MIDLKPVSDFNLHFLSGIDGPVFFVAARIFDLAPNDWERLTCEYYARNGFGEPKAGDRYIGKLPNGVESVRYHSVDALVLENPKVLSVTAKRMYREWTERKAKLAKNRNTPPPAPGDVFPEPMPEPKPEPQKTDPAKPIPAPAAKKPSPIPGIVWGFIKTVWGIIFPILLGMLKNFLLSLITKKRGEK